MVLARSKIINAIVELLKSNLDGNLYETNLFGNVENRLRFWDEINDYPYCCAVAGSEFREYQPGMFKWGFLNCIIRLYVQDENSQDKLEQALADIELLLDRNNTLSYDTNRATTDILVQSITTDEGVMAPIGIAEINLVIRYDIPFQE